VSYYLNFQRMLKSMVWVCICIPTLVYSAQSDHEPLEKNPDLSFSEILNSALENAPEILERDVRRQQVEDYESVSDTWFSGRPSLQLYYIDDQAYGNQGFREMEYAIQLQLKRPSEWRNGRLVSDSYAEQYSAWEQSLRHYITGHVRNSLADIAEAEANLLLEQQATRNSQELVSTTQVLVDSGELARLDLMQAENLLLNQRRIELQAEAMLADAERAYEILTGLQVRPAYVHTEALTELTEISPEQPQLVYLASDIQLAEALILQAQASVRGSPSISIGNRRQRVSDLASDEDGLALSLSIPFGGKNIVASRTSYARRDKADAEVLYQATFLALNQELHEAEHELFITEESILLAGQQSLLSESRWEMTQTAFTQGEISLAQVILAMQEALAARKQYELLLLQRERLITEFNQTVGVMP
jgi:cobalt-zinc-cadmium efflux system outer membrane protein